MADDKASAPPPETPATASATPAAASAASTSSQHAQAVRFLTSLRAQHSTSTISEQREFLRSKGLTEAQIDAAFEDAAPPGGLASAGSAAPAAPVTEEDPFDRAARAFDDPIHAPLGADVASLPSTAPELPSRSYPRSPLALYTSQAEAAATNAALNGQQAASAQQTRYEVLLGFFRSMSYMLVLGGGVTAFAVALYRTYILPRLVSTLSARSSLLKHHHGNYTSLLGSIRSLHSNSLVPEADRIQVVPNAPRPAAAGAGSSKIQASSSSQGRKGVLKRVSFADEVQSQEYDASGPAAPSQGAADDQAKKTSSIAKEGTKNEKAAALEDAGEDETSEKTPLLSDKAKAGIEGEEGAAAAEKAHAEGNDKLAEPKLKPVDVSSDLRSSLARLASALRADVSAASIGAPIVSDASSSSTTSSGAQAARVGNEEDEDELDDDAELEDSSDELEFDPFAPAVSASKKSKKKHSPTSASYRSSSQAAGQERKSANSLTSSLTALSSAIHAQAIQSNATSSFGFSSLSTPTPAAGSATKGPDPAQVKADIRSLKGLLLSRRNFPATGSFARPTTPMGMPGTASTGA